MGFVDCTREVFASQPLLIFSQHQLAPRLDSVTAKESPARANADTALRVVDDWRIFMLPVR